MVKKALDDQSTLINGNFTIILILTLYPSFSNSKTTLGDNCNVGILALRWIHFTG
jgi:hypothetical protein